MVLQERCISPWYNFILDINSPVIRHVIFYVPLSKMKKCDIFFTYMITVSYFIQLIFIIKLSCTAGASNVGTVTKTQYLCTFGNRHFRRVKYRVVLFPNVQNFVVKEVWLFMVIKSWYMPCIMTYNKQTCPRLIISRFECIFIIKMQLGSACLLTYFSTGFRNSCSSLAKTSFASSKTNSASF